MPLRDLDYQIKTLAQFDDYLVELSEQKKKADKFAELARENPDLDMPIPDFPTKTWEALNDAGKIPTSRRAIPYSTRDDGVGRSVPNMVFKVPTGGGKTYLGVSALCQIVGS